MKLDLPKEWFERKAGEEGDHEVAAGRQWNLANPSAEDIAEMKQVALDGLPHWAKRTIEELQAERDEADRRAGAAERARARSADAAAGRAEWLSKAKREEGYTDITSFDVVWAEVRARAARADAAETEAVQLRERVAALEAGLRALLQAPAIADENHSDPSWGCQETAEAVAAARTLVEGGST